MKKREKEMIKGGEVSPRSMPIAYGDVERLIISVRGQLSDLRSKISSAKISSKSRVLPKAFTEKGLYMLATILKSKRAMEATFAIIETFAKVRTLRRELVELHNAPKGQMQAEKMRHFGESLSDIIMPDLETMETESSLELNFLIGKLKHTVRRIKRADHKTQD